MRKEEKKKKISEILFMLIICGNSHFIGNKNENNIDDNLFRVELKIFFFLPQLTKRKMELGKKVISKSTQTMDVKYR